MPDISPVIYLLHGDDETGLQQFISGRLAALGDPEMAKMGTSRLDGKGTSESELHDAVMSLPFFTSKRLVIVSNALAKFESKRAGENGEEKKESSKTQDGRANFLALLDEVPDTTELILVVSDHRKWRAGNYQWETITDRHFLSKWLQTHPERMTIVGFPLPTEHEMPGWIQKKTRELNGNISQPASLELAQYVGTDTRLAVLELDKLITYSNGRVIEAEDVQTVSTSIASTTIWNLTDAIGEKNARKAVTAFHQLLETLDPRQEIFPMLIWSFRQLLLGREVVEQGGGVNELQSMLQITDFQAKKLFSQVKSFNLTQLKKAYQRLMEIEELSKGADRRGGTDDLSVLIDQMIIELAH